MRAGLSALATGILLFLLWDVLSHGVEPVESALEGAVSDGGSWGRFVGLAALLAAGFTAGLTTLVYYDRAASRRSSARARRRWTSSPAARRSSASPTGSA